MSYTTTIKSQIEVSGISELKSAVTALKELNAAGKGLNSLRLGGILSDMGKVTSSAERATSMIKRQASALNETAKSSSTATLNAEKLAQAHSKTAEMASKASLAQKRQTEGVFKMLSAQERAQQMAIKTANAQERETTAIAKSVAQAEKLASARQKDLALTAKYTAQANQVKQGGAYVAGSSSNKGGTVKNALATGLSMFAPSMLLASGIMGVAGGIGSLASGSFETLKERQNGQAMWATSIQDAHRNITGDTLTNKAVQANNQIMATTLKAGNNFSEGNAMAKQIYSSDAGVYSGNAGKTNSMLRGIFNIQDANALTEGEMTRMRTAIGNIGDTGKMSAMQAKSLNLLDGKITRSIRKEYERETGKQLGKTATGGWDWSKVSAQTAFRGIDTYGNSGGVGKASERYNATLPGMLRAGKSAATFLGSEIIDQFGKKVGKSGGFSNLIGNLSKTFTDFNGLKGLANKASSALSASANFIGTGITEILSVTKPFRSGFAKGFVSELGTIKDSVSDLVSWAGNTYNKLSAMLPKGAGNSINTFGQGVGKVSALLLALKGASKLPVIGKLFSGVTSQVGRLLSKVPLIGGLLAKIFGTTGKTSASGTMMTAANTMMAAANKMNGGGGTSGGAVSSSGALTLSEKLANSKFGGVIDKTFLKGASLAGKGGIAGTLGKLLMGGSSGLGKLALGGTGLLSKIGGSGIGKLLGGTLKRGSGGLNALFAGFDLYSAIKTTKSGTTARNKGVGSAIGGGVGGTLGAALGSFVGPLGTIAGGMAGSWLGGKAGSAIGGQIKGWSKQLKALKLPKFKLPSFSWNKVKEPGWFKWFKGGKLKLPKLSLKDTGLTKLTNPFKNWKMPKFKLPKFKFKNPFKGWKMPKFKFPKLPNWVKSFMNWGKGAKKAKKETDNANKSTKQASKHLKSAERSGSSLGKTLSKMFSGVGKSSSKVWKSLASSVKSGINKAKSNAKSGAKGVNSALKFNNLTKSVRPAFNKVSSTIKSAMSKAKSSARSGANGVSSAIKSGMSKASSAGKSAMSKFSRSIKSGFNQAKSNAKGGTNSITSSMRSGMNKASEAGKSGMNKFSDTIKSGMSKANSSAKSGGAKIVSSIKSSMAKAVSASDSATSKIAKSMDKIGSSADTAKAKVSALASEIRALKSKTITINVNTKKSKLANGTPGARGAFAKAMPAYANGTGGRGHGGGLAMVNDAKGANWREAFMLPDGLVGLFPKERNMTVPLPPGTQVLNGDDTKKMFPHYADGTNGAKKAFGSSAPAVNVTVNINGNASASDAQSIATTVGNAIGEKLMTIYRPVTI